MTVFDMVKKNKKHLHFDDTFLLAALLTKADQSCYSVSAVNIIRHFTLNILKYDGFITRSFVLFLNVVC